MATRGDDGRSRLWRGIQHLIWGEDSEPTLREEIEDAIDEGSNLSEAAARAKLQVTETPLITADGTDRSNPAFKLPAELAAALKSGFELAPSDEPVIETLANDAGYVLVAPSQVVAAAPAPLADLNSTL